MAELRWQWGDGEPQDHPTPPGAHSLALLVGERVVWSGDVSAELSAWARWCALQAALVVELSWDCPDVVWQYLETGDDTLRVQANEAVVAKFQRNDVNPKPLDGRAEVFTLRALSTVTESTDAAVNEKARFIAGESVRALASFAAYRAHEACVVALTPRYYRAKTPPGILVEAGKASWRAQQDTRREAPRTLAAQLRSLLLQRALPPQRHPLIEAGPEGELVLCDALLEHAGGRRG